MTQHRPHGKAKGGGSRKGGKTWGGKKRGRYATSNPSQFGGAVDMDTEVKIAEIENREREVQATNNQAKAIGKQNSIWTAIKKDLSPYIVLLLVILFIAFLVYGIFDLRPAAKKTSSALRRLMDWLLYPFKAIFGPIFEMFGYRFRLAVRMVTPFVGKQPSIPRQRIMSGRCDNQRWIQVDMQDNPQLDVDGKRGYCMSAIRPKDIQWDLDVSKMPEYSDIPQELQKNLQSKMSVIIPYDKEETVQNGNTFFVPRCDKAYFRDAKDDKGNPLPAKLLEEMGTACKLTSHPFPRGSYGVDGATKAALLQTKQW